MKPRSVPMRTCAGCRQQRTKRDMVRVVRRADGAVRVDPTGKGSGRGTYVCPRRECWTAALRTGSLGRVLKTPLGEDDLSELRAYAASLPDADAMANASPVETIMR